MSSESSPPDTSGRSSPSRSSPPPSRSAAEVAAHAAINVACAGGAVALAVLGLVNPIMALAALAFIAAPTSAGNVLGFLTSGRPPPPPSARENGRPDREG